MRIRSTPQSLLLALVLLFSGSSLFAQQYHALHGSDYAGAPAIFNNPASNVNARHPWDVTLLNLNAAFISNAIYLKKFQFPSATNFSPTLVSGTQNRVIHAAIDVGIVNAMYQVNAKEAIGFGLRLRTVNHIRISNAAFSDTVSSFHQFLKANRHINFIDINGRHGGWLSFDMNYGKTLFETPIQRVNIGATLHVMKGISGAYGSINRLSYLESTTAFDTAYKITNGAGTYAYSSNYDNWNPNFSTIGNIRQWVNRSPLSLGLSIGAEFIWYKDEDAAAANKSYVWKLGVSILDIGSVKFRTSEFTGNFGNPKSSVEDWQISNKLENIADARGLRDSLATLFDTTTALPRTFSVKLPTRIVINSDHALGNDFFLNLQASLNLHSSSYGRTRNLRELSLLTITPRWETRNWGIYAPVQFNTQGQLWTGIAFKAGPLVMGVHDLRLLTKKDPILNGGFYLLLQVHPFKEKARKSRYDCL